jgi:hypothetical protein
LLHPLLSSLIIRELTKIAQNADRKKWSLAKREKKLADNRLAKAVHFLSFFIYVSAPRAKPDFGSEKWGFFYGVDFVTKTLCIKGGIDYGGPRWIFEGVPVTSLAAG